MNILYKFFAISILILLFVSTAHSVEPKINQGWKSIYFSIKGLDDIGFDNSTFGFQYIFQDKWATWAELGFTNESNKPSENAQEIVNNKFHFLTGVLYYAYQNASLATYISPQLGYSIGVNENTSAKITSTDIIAGFSIGVEWWIFENVSIAASTLFGYIGTTEETSNGSQVINKSTSTRLGILGNSNSKFLISFYF